MLILAVVRLASDSPRRCCPICGSELVVIEYRGKKPDFLALAQSPDFCCFLGCVRVDLHDKVVDGVNYRGKVFVKRVFHRGYVRRCKRMS